MRRGGRLLFMAVALAALAPASAGAATTVGSSLRQRANLYVRCSSSCTAVESARPGGAGLTIPSDGVITRWRVRAATVGQVRLRILRPETDGGYTAIAASDPTRLDRPHEPGQDVLYEFPARIAVHAGDVIALDRDARAGALFHTYGTNDTYAVATFTPALKDDATDVQPGTNTSGRELLLNADVEPDGDGDGFGDETQDNCPTIANDQTDKPCSTPAPTPTEPQGPTSTPVDTTPPPRNGGSAGPPVAGEPAIDKTQRRHTSRNRARKAPPKSGNPTRVHNRRPGARKSPPKTTRPDSEQHGSKPRARPKPVNRERPTAGHTPVSPRPKPPSTKRSPEQPHDGSPEARPTPHRKPNPPSRHRSTTHRSAPHPAPAPGWQSHDV